MRNICFIAGTRPEVIKVAPVYRYFKKEGKYKLSLCLTGQHRTMAEQALDIFQISPDIDLNLMTHNQTLNSLSSKIFDLIPNVYEQLNPDLLFVQGDTTTAATSAMAAFNMRIPVAHIEAGLRTNNLNAPFPEEFNRRLISSFSKFNFVPTNYSREALLKEGCDKDSIFITGNTVVDALDYIKQNFDLNKVFSSRFGYNEQFVLVTAHRRENFGAGFESICRALSDAANLHPEIHFVYPVHLNPNVQVPVKKLLVGKPNIHLLEPVSYIELLALLSRCLFCMTDSGGIQEEAPSFNKYTIVFREYTERMESIYCGISELVGTDYGRISKAIANQLAIPRLYEIEKANNPFGDGKSSERIFTIIDKYFSW